MSGAQVLLVVPQRVARNAVFPSTKWRDRVWGDNWGARAVGTGGGGLEFSVALSFGMESGPGDWGSLTKALRAERGAPNAPAAHGMLQGLYKHTSTPDVNK